MLKHTHLNNWGKAVSNKPAAKKRDKCVICGKQTPYTKDTHIDRRKHYVEGCDKRITQAADEIADCL